MPAPHEAKCMVKSGALEWSIKLAITGTRWRRPWFVPKLEQRYEKCGVFLVPDTISSVSHKFVISIVRSTDPKMLASRKAGWSPFRPNAAMSIGLFLLTLCIPLIIFIFIQHKLLNQYRDCKRTKKSFILFNFWLNTIQLIIHHIKWILTF